MFEILTWEEVGSFLMGFFVAWIAFYFFNRAETFNGTEFAAFMAAIFGGAIISVFSTFLIDDNKWIFWFYPIGLVFGMICFYICAFIVKDFGKAPAARPPKVP